jgi:hypothetical protein
MENSLSLSQVSRGMSKLELIKKEREDNLRYYSEHKNQLLVENRGKYVVIAKGDIQAVADSFDQVKEVAPDANHRFIFKVEPKDKVKAKLRWPMKAI